MGRGLTDVAIALSLAAERGHGQLPEHQVRVAVLATRLASDLGLEADERRDCFDSALLRCLGCTAVAHSLSSWWGDEIAAHRRAARFGGPLDPLLGGWTPHHSPVSLLPTPALGGEWVRTTAALAGRLEPAARQEIVRRRAEALDELERRAPSGFARWLTAERGLCSDPADFVRGDRTMGTDAA